jgi:hypothetical protein
MYSYRLFFFSIFSLNDAFDLNEQLKSSCIYDGNKQFIFAVYAVECETKRIK